MTAVFTVFVTGRPASGKTTLARAVVERLKKRRIPAVHLESDAVRSILVPDAGYGPEDRERAYRALGGLAELLTAQGYPVVIDATAGKRLYRERIRSLLPRFFEVFVATPPETCESRDPKGLYRKFREGDAPDLPGAGVPYEEPERPDVVVSGSDAVARAADEVLHRLEAKGFL